MKNTESPEASEKFGEKTEHGFSMMKKKGVMFCTSCKTTSNQNELVKGCRSFRLESVKIHENSEVHKHACEVVSNREKKVSATYSSI
jgi:hypothetical protein